MKNIAIIALIGSVGLGAGCIHKNKTVYRDVERIPVSFETETAGRVFYEALSKMPPQNHSESKTEISIPIVFEVSRTEVTGSNTRFNEGVSRCDTNKDGKITEVEANIFAAQVQK